MALLDIPVGPFRLHRLIGVGGAGEVWQGVHVTQSIPVALKVITAARARDARYRDAFHHEVRAVAGLSHPGIVVIFDTGVIDAQAERASLGRMVAGSPYLVMELATRGSLRTHPTPARWDALRAHLQWLLQTLAHAHARGVIHRDLKPGNVLVFDEPADPRHPEVSRFKLTDFGLAHPTDRAERVVRGTSGTPIFMAPEQFRGQWRDFGPWTDLYALGCMAFALATGKPPFRGRGISQLMRAHLHRPPPPLTPRFPVPEGFEAWVHRLMHKDPLQRFHRAADAIHALLELGDPPADLPAGQSPELAPMRSHQPTGDATHTSFSWSGFEGESPVARAPAAEPPEVEMCARRIPPLPPTWYNGQPIRRSIRLVGAGLGLYGMREVPLVGRRRERDRIWEMLREAREAGEPRCCVLRGPAGCGKSRLAEWMSQRADELGNALVLRAMHSPEGGPADGLSPMIAAGLGCLGLGRAEMAQRVEQFLHLRGIHESYEFNALMELLWPQPGEDDGRGDPPFRFFSANERYALTHRMLGHLASRQGDEGEVRPVVLWIDDAQWANDALGFVHYLLSLVSPDSQPVLVLVTVRDESLEEREAEREALDRVLAQSGCEELELGPLDGEERRELVQKLLYLEGELAAQVEERTGGNPLFAVQLVGDWVQRGVLEVGATGFVLRQGESAIIPDDLHALWEGRIRRLVETHGPDTRPALELAALLGNQVDDGEWRGSCRVADLEPSSELVADLMIRRLARPRIGGWSFEHGMMRESLERSAYESGRARTLHLAAATTLQIRHDATRQPGLAERLGRHLFHAGRYAEALEPLRVGARERRAMSDYIGTRQLLEMREEVLGRLEVPPNDAQWGELWVQQAEILAGQGRLEQAMQRGMLVVDAGSEFGWKQLMAPAWRISATALGKMGHFTTAVKWLRRAEEAAQAVRDDLEGARTLLWLGDVLCSLGRHEEASRPIRSALARFEALENLRGQADAAATLAHVYRVTGDTEQMERMTRRAIEVYDFIENRFGLGLANNTLGDVLRARGSLEEAERHYVEAENLLRSIGSPEYYVPMLNTALSVLLRQRYSEARDRLMLLLQAMRRTGRLGLEGIVHIALLVCQADADDWEGWDRHMQAGLACLERTSLVDADIADLAEFAAGIAQEKQQFSRARDAWLLAARQWEAMGRIDRVEKVRSMQM